MIPIRDDIPARKAPVVTVGLIALNLAIFGMCATMPERDLQVFLFKYGFIPAKLLRPDLVASHYLRQFGFIVPSEYSLSESIVPMFTSMFLHGGWVHVIGNMWILWIFGDNVEDCFGHLGFLLFYLACGIFATIVHFLTAPASPIVTVGASGAIAGVMGAYMLLYPNARVWTLVWIFFLIDFWPVPAYLYLFVWFFIQVLSGVASLGTGGMLPGVAWWAHIGGFVAGAGFVLLTGVRPRRRPARTFPRYRYAFDPRTGRFVPRPPRSRDDTLL